MISEHILFKGKEIFQNVVKLTYQASLEECLNSF